MNTFLHRLQRLCPLTGKTVVLEAPVSVERGGSCAISTSYGSFTCPEMEGCPHYRSGDRRCPILIEQEGAIER